MSNGRFNRVIMNIIDGIVFLHTSNVGEMLAMVSRVLKLEFPLTGLGEQPQFCGAILSLIMYAECNMLDYIHYKENTLFHFLYINRYDYCQTLCTMID